MRYFTGHVATDVVGSEVTFEFEVEDDATDEDIENAAIAAFWESGVVDIWYEDGGEEE